MDLRASLNEEFDLLSYILTGDEAQDRLITGWFTILSNGNALHYILDNIPEYSLSVIDLLDYSLINYLFCFYLLNKADLTVGLSSI
jgi:hypothetical protein